MSLLGSNSLVLALTSSLVLASSSALAQSAAPADAPQAPVAQPPVQQPTAPQAEPAVVAPVAQQPVASAPTPAAPPETIYAAPSINATARYLQRSFSLLGGATFGAGYSPTINTTVGADLAAGAEVRFAYRGLIVAGSLAFKITGISLPMAPTGAAVGALIVPGVGAGYQFGLTPALALGAVLRYNASIFAAASASASHTITADVPLTIHVGINGIIEPFVQAGLVIGGVSTTGGSATSTQVTALVLGGLRFGVTL
ncbi:MAG: hypothetical protein U0269_34040 [Polyangiales bacterium]